MQEQSNRIWLHRYTVLIALATFGLIVAGAQVTSNAAGDAIPSWPLVRGDSPGLADLVFYQYVHRVVAMSVGLLTIGLVVWLGRSESRRWVRGLGYVGLVLLVAQGLLGAARVSLSARPALAVMHAALSHVFFCVTVVLAAATSHDWDREAPPEAADPGKVPLLHLAIGCMVAIYTQVLLGAALRHHALTVLPHVIMAMVVGTLGVLVIARVLLRHAADPALRRTGLTFAWLLLLQMALGLGAYGATFMGFDPQVPLGFTSAHVAAGAVLLAVAVVLVLRSRRIPGVLGTPVMVVSEQSSAASR